MERKHDSSLLCYNPNSSLETVTYANGVTHVYGYDTNNRLRTKESPQGTLTYGYDSLNRLANVREGSPTASPLASYGYNTNGSLQKVAYANGLRQEYRYDTLNRLRYLDTLNAADAHNSTRQICPTFILYT